MPAATHHHWYSAMLDRVPLNIRYANSWCKLNIFQLRPAVAAVEALARAASAAQDDDEDEASTQMVRWRRPSSPAMQVMSPDHTGWCPFNTGT